MEMEKNCLRYPVSWFCHDKRHTLDHSFCCSTV